MRLIAFHDDEGNITGLLACPVDAPAVYPATEPGKLVTHVEAPEISELDGQERFEHLSDLANNYQVDIQGKSGLTRTVDSKTKRTNK